MKIFVDIEANYDENENYYLLQIAAIKSDNGKVEIFNEYCKSKIPLNNHVKELLHKDDDFFNKFNLTEKDLYIKFSEFVGNNTIFTYGDKDKIFLSHVKNRYHLEQRIKLANYQLEVNHICGIRPKIGLQSILNLMNIENKNEHDAYEDVRLFKKAFYFFNSKKKDKKFIKKIIEEQLRPKNKNLRIINYNKVIEPKIEDNYGYIIFSDSIKSKKNDNNEIIGYSLKIDYKKINHNKKIIDSFNIEKHSNEIQLLENELENFYRNYLHKNFDNNIYIIDIRKSNPKKMMNLYFKENNSNLVNYLWFDLKFYLDYKNKFNEEFNEIKMLYFIDGFYNKQTKKFNMKRSKNVN